MALDVFGRGMALDGCFSWGCTLAMRLDEVVSGRRRATAVAAGASGRKGGSVAGGLKPACDSPRLRRCSRYPGMLSVWRK